MQVMCDQIQYLHNELNKLKGTSYKVLIDNEQLKKDNMALQEQSQEMSYKQAFDQMKVQNTLLNEKIMNL